MKIARKPLTEREELDGRILWFEALQDSIEDGQTQEAIDLIESHLRSLRKQRTSTVGGDDRRKQSA